MSWVSSSYIQNKDRFFHVAAQPLCVSVKSYWSQRKLPGLELHLSKADAFPHFTSLIFLSGCSMATSETWGREFKTDLSTCSSPTSLEGKTVVWSHHIPFVRTHHPEWWKIPENYFPLKYFPREIQHPRKGKARGYITSTRQKPLCAVSSHISGKRLFAYFYFPSTIATVM